MYDPSSAGTPGPIHTHPVRRIQAQGPPRFEVASWDDQYNELHGITYRDRMRILFAVEDVVLGARNEGPEAHELRGAYVAWVALEILRRVAHHKRLQWGTGPLGDADVTPRSARPGRGKPRKPPRREDLLLNLIRPEHVDHRFRHLNYPHEIRRIRNELFEAFYSRGTYLPARDLMLGVIEYLVRRESSQAPRDYMQKAEATLALRRNLAVPGLRCPFNHMTLSWILDYYGLGTRKRDGNRYGYYVKAWRVEALTRLWQRDRFIDLRDVYWMKDRYVEARHGHMPASTPGTSAAMRQETEP